MKFSLESIQDYWKPVLRSRIVPRGSGRDRWHSAGFCLTVSLCLRYTEKDQNFALFERCEGCGVLDLGSILGTEINGEFLGRNFG